MDSRSHSPVELFSHAAPKASLHATLSTALTVTMWLTVRGMAILKAYTGQYTNDLMAT